MKDIKARIISNIKVRGNYYKMALEAPEIAKLAKPGQFVEVRCSDSYEPLLRRPFSIHKVPLDFARGRKGERLRVKGIEILYEVMGRGTEILSHRKSGEVVDVLGPLGSGFKYTLHPSPSTILIAGGIGVAPLVFLAEELKKVNPSTTLRVDGEQSRTIKSQKVKGKTIVLIGARTKDMILCEKDFKEMGCEVYVATDDGTKGYNGFASELLAHTLSTNHYPLTTTVYACGPEPMLKSVAEICKEHRLHCQVSLETKMACGFGACLGCVVKIKGEGWRVKGEFDYKLACKDGPVFDAEELA